MAKKRPTLKYKAYKLKFPKSKGIKMVKLAKLPKFKPIRIKMR